ncbi:hypothetical protein LCGC14_2501490, partial [marine sediment metagenome]
MRKSIIYILAAVIAVSAGVWATAWWYS